jgi:PhnB protein
MTTRRYFNMTTVQGHHSQLRIRVAQCGCVQAGRRRSLSSKGRAMKLYTHLNFGGDCEEAFRFYEKHLGGQITMMMKRSEMPGASDAAASGSADPVIHARMTVAGVELIGNDVPVEYFQPIRSSYLYLAVDSAEAAESIYAALSTGGKVSMAMTSTFFASRFAQLRDRFGTLWTLIHEKQR